MQSPRHEITLRFLAEPADVNFGGKVHGGAVMKWIDQAGYTCAVAWSGHYCVTAHVGGIRFLRPITIGHVVEVTARLMHTGRTSVHLLLTVRSGDPKGGKPAETTRCTMVFVALGADGRPATVPPWEPRTPAARLLQGFALKQMEMTNAIDQLLTTIPVGRPPGSLVEAAD
jgi:acyl-CoA hydrolase